MKHKQLYTALAMVAVVLLVGCKKDRHAGALYLDGHIGAEYHISQKIGIFLDLSSGVSTFGLAIH